MPLSLPLSSRAGSPPPPTPGLPPGLGPPWAPRGRGSCVSVCREGDSAVQTVDGRSCRHCTSASVGCDLVGTSCRSQVTCAADCGPARPAGKVFALSFGRCSVLVGVCSLNMKLVGPTSPALPGEHSCSPHSGLRTHAASLSPCAFAGILISSLPLNHRAPGRWWGRKPSFCHNHSLERPLMRLTILRCWWWWRRR